MTELVDIRLHHQIAHEIYRQQMMQRLPGMHRANEGLRIVKYPGSGVLFKFLF